MDDSVGTDDIVGFDDSGGAHDSIAVLLPEQNLLVAGLSAQAGVDSGPLIHLHGPVLGLNAGRNHVEEQQILEGFEVSGFEKKSLELGVQISLQRLISGREDCDIVLGNGFFERLKQEGFLHQLGKLSVVRIEQGDEDRIGIDLDAGT